MAYAFPLTEALQYFCTWTAATLNTQGVTVNVIPFVFTLATYQFDPNQLPQTIVEVEKLPARRGGRDLSNATDYAFEYHLTLWRVVERTGTNSAEIAELSNFQTFAATLANNRTLTNETYTDGVFNDSCVHGLLIGDDNKCNQKLQIDGLSDSMCAVGLCISLEIVCQR